MELNYKQLLMILVAIASKSKSEVTYFGDRILTDGPENNSELYTFEMALKENVEHCIVSCKTKKQCKFINYDHRTKLCYHITSDSTKFLTLYDSNIKDYLIRKPGFSYGAKRDWDMTGYENCSNCHDYGVCQVNSEDKDFKCLNSGCKRPDMKKNAILRGNMYSIGNKIEYECKEGFNKTTPKPMTSVCLENGSWSTVGVECLPEATFDENAYTFDNKVYKFILETPYTWDKANEICKRRAMQQVNIKGAEEQVNIIKLIRDNSFNAYCFWTGGRANTDGILVWRDGLKIPVGDEGGHWYKNEPSSPKTEKCVQLRREFGFEWNDENCQSLCFAICELIF